MLFPRFITFALVLAFAMVFNVAMAGPYPSFITSSQNVNWNQNLYAWNSQYNCPTYNQQPLFYSDNQFFYELANIRYYVQGCNLSPNICLTYPVNTWNPLSYNGYSAWSWNNLRLRYNNGWNFL